MGGAGGAKVKALGMPLLGRATRELAPLTLFTDSENAHFARIFDALIAWAHELAALLPRRLAVTM